MTVAMEPHHITLSDSSVLALDYAEDAKEYRVAYYLRRAGNEDGAPISAAKFDDLVRRGILPRGYHTSWKRKTARNKVLLFAIGDVLRDTKLAHENMEITEYIHGTEWGKDLP